VAAKLILDRLWPCQKGRAVEFALPAVTDPNAILAAHGALLRSLAGGLLTPDEAEGVSRMLSVHLRAIEASEVEARLRVLEAAHAP
jgi:hypothetical protein